jgi:polyhydroxyalkanoate synthesis repressor PhaR
MAFFVGAVRVSAGWPWAPAQFGFLAGLLQSGVSSDHGSGRCAWLQPEGLLVQKSKADASSTPSGSVRIIKKYPNRRLYDTDTSSYITLAEVKSLVMESEPFVVRDAKTNDDLTRSILLQIILEEETAGVPIFTEQVLANIIRFYGHSMQEFMGSYLEKNVQIFMDLQQKMTEQSTGLNPEMWKQFVNTQSPMMQGMMGTYMEQSRKAFTQMQEQMQKNSEQMLAALGLKR